MKKRIYPNYMGKTIKYSDSRGFIRKGFVLFHDAKAGFITVRPFNGTKEFSTFSDSRVMV